MNIKLRVIIIVVVIIVELCRLLNYLVPLIWFRTVHSSTALVD